MSVKPKPEPQSERVPPEVRAYASRKNASTILQTDDTVPTNYALKFTGNEITTRTKDIDQYRVPDGYELADVRFNTRKVIVWIRPEGE